MSLVVCLDGVVAGTLTTAAGQPSFSYADDWLNQANAYPLSVSIPLKSRPISGAAITNFLWGLLPDNERTLSAWAQEFQVSARNPAALLEHVGEDCAGAVQFVTEERVPAVVDLSKRAEQMDWLTEREFEERIVRLARDGAAGRASTREGQFSLAGAQSKTAFYFDSARGRWGVPRGRTPTTHILKPAANDFDGFAANEHFCLTLVRNVGLAAASSEWRTIGDVPTLIVERYDRIREGSRWHRIHQEDFCQALDVHPVSKYENDGGPGLARIMALPDEAASLARKMGTAGGASPILSAIVDGIAGQSAITLRYLDSPAR